MSCSETPYILKVMALYLQEFVALHLVSHNAFELYIMFACYAMFHKRNFKMSNK